MRPAPDTGWTYTRMLAELPEGSRYELYGGNLVPMSPSPSYEHNRISRRLEKILSRIIEDTGIGEIMHAPMDVELAPNEVVQPDLFVLLYPIQARIARHIIGAPELVIEIVSPGSSKSDRIEKKAIYARHGVKEYWLVDPAYKAIEINTLQGNSYQTHDYAELQGEVSSALLPELVVTCEEVFGEARHSLA